MSGSLGLVHPPLSWGAAALDPPTVRRCFDADGPRTLILRRLKANAGVNTLTPLNLEIAACIEAKKWSRICFLTLNSLCLTVEPSIIHVNLRTECQLMCLWCIRALI